MKNDNVITLEKPVENEDALTYMLRRGARDLLTKAVQSELSEFLAQYQDVTDDQGRQSVVRNGYLPEREIMTGIGPVEIKVPKTRDRSGQGVHFRSALFDRISNGQRALKQFCPGSTSKGSQQVV